MGFLSRKAAKIDQQRWGRVRHLMRSDETELHNTPCKVHYADQTASGFAFVSSQALMWAYDDGELVNQTQRISFVDIAHLTPKEGSCVWIGWHENEDRIGVTLEFYPSPLSQALYDELLDRVKAAHTST